MNARNIIFIFFFAVVRMLPANAQLDSVIGLPYPQKATAIQFLLDTGYKRTPEETRGVYEQLLKKAKSKTDVLWIKKNMLRYNIELLHDTANIAQTAEQLVNEALEVNDPALTASLYWEIGNYYENYMSPIVDRNLGFEYHLKAYSIIHKLSKAQYPDRDYEQYTLVRDYYDFYDYDNALKYGTEIEGDTTSATWIQIFIYDVIGMAYLKTERYDQAIVYFNKILPLTGSPNDYHWVGIADGNIGIAWYLQGRYDKAIPYLLKGTEICRHDSVWDNVAQFSLKLANIYLDRKNIPLAKQYLDIGRSSALKAGNNKIFYELYNSLYAFYRQMGDLVAALRYMDTAIVYQTIIARELDLSKKAKAEMALENERRVMSEKLLANEKENHRIVRNSLAGAVVCLLVISLLVFNRQRLKNRNREQQLLAEKQLAEQELASASLRLNDFAKNVREKNDLIAEATRQIEQVNAEINTLKNSSAAQAPVIINTTALQQLQDSILLTNDDWISFTELFEKVYPGFFNRLKHSLPSLSPAETRFMALCKLKYSNKEMAGMLGIGSDAVRQYRSRLRKKLNLPEQTSFEDMADGI